MRLTRRFFLRSSGIALVGLAGVPSFLLRAARTLPGRDKVLVVLFQRGAADGLNIVVPHAEPSYYDLRPGIAIGRPKREDEQSAIDLDGFFGLHPAMAPLHRLWKDEMLAVIHAAGSPDSTRSHFDAQDFMESGTPGLKSTRDGWLNRYLGSGEQGEASTFRAVSVTSQLPRILQGNAPALAIPRLDRFGIDRGRYADVARRGLESMYAASADPLLGRTARETFEAMELLERVDPAQHRPAHGAEYPPGEFGTQMLQIAQMIKSGIGLEIVFAELGGWDHHVNEGGAQGQLANLLRKFSAGIAAFFRDLGDRAEDVVLVTLSEFGRTVKENGSRGTDHGHATAMLVAGGAIRGGKAYGPWPGLGKEQRFEGRDLAVTTDFRDVVGQLITRHLGAESLDAVFPGHTLNAANLRGLFPEAD